MRRPRRWSGSPVARRQVVRRRPGLAGLEPPRPGLHHRVLTGLVDALARPVGRAVRSILHRPPDGAADRVAGLGVLAAVATTALAGPVAGAVVGGLVAGAPALRSRSARNRRVAGVVEDVPDVVDLLRLAVESGLEVTAALAAVTDHLDGDGDVATALRRVDRRLRRGDALGDALIELVALGEPARALHEALVAGHRHGVPLGPTLERAGAEARATRRRRREEAARVLPVKLLFPLVFCTLPALVILTVVPLLVRSIPSLTP